jgi:hypothetical protein
MLALNVCSSLRRFRMWDQIFLNFWKFEKYFFTRVERKKKTETEAASGIARGFKYV